MLRTTLEFKDGTEEDVRILGTVYYNEQQYVVLLSNTGNPVNYIYRIKKEKKDTLTLEYIEDSDEFKAVCNVVMRQVRRA